MLEDVCRVNYILRYMSNPACFGVGKEAEAKDYFTDEFIFKFKNN